MQSLLDFPFSHETFVKDEYFFGLDRTTQIYWEKIEKRFSIFEFCLGINFFHFRLRRFGQVEEQLGSPGAGVEIDTG